MRLHHRNYTLAEARQLANARPSSRAAALRLAYSWQGNCDVAMVLFRGLPPSRRDRASWTAQRKDEAATALLTAAAGVVIALAGFNTV